MSEPFLFSLSDSEKIDLFEAASTQTGVPAYVVEKDYHVTLILKVLFEELKPTCQQHADTPFLFKGGTTLSKVFGCIERMSEDIDLSLHMDYLGYPVPEQGDASNSARKKRIEQLEAAAKNEISSKIAPFLAKRLGAFSDRYLVQIADNGLNIDVSYPRFLSDDAYGDTYVTPRVLLECGGKAGFDPNESHNIAPIALMATGQAGDECSVDVLGCDRTFFEKITLMHELNNRGADRLGERQSRHIYDIVQIHAAFPHFITDTTLLAAVVAHKHKYFSRAAAKWEEAQPGTLRLVPEGDVADRLEADWEKMADMFPSELPYTFAELQDKLRVISAVINEELVPE
tara:strand:+ start:1583 stop:2611 length:1029 start_codon:yes stop_codon:yes gene_type:complete